MTAGPAAVVLVHGFGGTPATVAPVASALRADGLGVATPALAPADGPWDAWVSSVRAALPDGDGRVVLAGQSLGAAVVLAVASSLPAERVAGVVLVNPLAVPTDEDTLEFLEGRMERGKTEVPNERASFADPGASEPEAPAMVPVAGILASHRGVAALVSNLEGSAPPPFPVVLLRAVHDDVLGPEHAERLASLLGDAVTVKELPKGRHVATLDLDRDLIAAEITALARRA